MHHDFASSPQFFPFTRQASIDGAPRADLDIWMLAQTPNGWDEPIHLGPEVNTTDNDELYPSVAGDGTLYLASAPIAPQPGKHFDIHRAGRRGNGFAMREALGPMINTVPSTADVSLQDAWDLNPEISVDGKTLIFTSLRPGGLALLGSSAKTAPRVAGHTLTGRRVPSGCWCGH